MDSKTGGRGKVYLIGAGPGDPGLLTLAGAAAIASADVIVYDRLAHPRTLEHAREDAELIYAGKTPDRHTLTQDQINGVLVEKAGQGLVVARVKGGDPFVFGRGGEEAEALEAAGLAFEVIPGVTSAISVPAYAGIPVTHRDFTSAVSIITGHEEPGRDESRINWEALGSSTDTLVFLMGVKNLQLISGRLIEHGRSPDTPAAVIQWGTRANQKTVTGTLSGIAAAVEASGIGSPAVTVVGEVVTLREKLRWFDRRPLFGRRIVVTRSREQASALVEGLSQLGADVIEFPSIACRPLASTPVLDRAIKELSSYGWVIFTSANGVKFFFEKLSRAGMDARALAGCRIAAIGTATAEALQLSGLAADYVPSRSIAETFADEFPEDPSGQKLLLPTALETREIIRERLEGRGASVTVAPCYETVTPPAATEAFLGQLESGPPDAVTFTSSSTVRSFLNLVAGFRNMALGPETVVASIGPITSATAAEFGLEVDVEAAEHTVAGLIEAICRKLSA